MKLTDYILLSLAVVSLIIGIDQLMRSPKEAWLDSYWLFMATTVCLLFLNYRKLQRRNAPTDTQKIDKTKKTH
jgi:hypothetical protein